MPDPDDRPMPGGHVNRSGRLFRQLETGRDLLVYAVGDNHLVLATDSLGGVGGPSGATPFAEPELAGQLAMRACLLSVVSVGATPFGAVLRPLGNAEAIGERLAAGLRNELEAAGCPQVAIDCRPGWSPPLPVAGFMLGLLAQTDLLRWRRSLPGDHVYLLGRPIPPGQLFACPREWLSASALRDLLDVHPIGDCLPVQPGGLRATLDLLAAETDLGLELESAVDPRLLEQPAGPASCVLLTSPGLLPAITTCLRLGTLVETD